MDVKVCSRCEVEFPLDHFKVMNQRTGRICSMCPDCKREYDREYWAKVKAEKQSTKRENSKKIRIERRKYIVETLKKSKCQDCGNED